MHYSTACALIFKHYGIEAQKRKLQEECAELIRAIARDDEENMLEEMSDVLFIIEQFETDLKKTSCLAIDCLGCTCTDKECGIEYRRL